MKLKETYYPPKARNVCSRQYVKGVPMLLLRDDDPKLRPLPIFGPFSPTRAARPARACCLCIVTSRSSRAKAKQKAESDVRRVFELATLPNEKSIEAYQYDVMDIIRDQEPNKKSKLADLLEQQDYRKYQKGFAPYRARLKDLLEKNEKRPYFLALELERMLKDRGTGAKDSPNLEEFWSNADPQVQVLLDEVKELLHKVRYGDGAPFILANSYGKGKVVTMMSTAGSQWLDWVGGTLSTTALSSRSSGRCRTISRPRGATSTCSLGKKARNRRRHRGVHSRTVTGDGPHVSQGSQGKAGHQNSRQGAARERGQRKSLTFTYPITAGAGRLSERAVLSGRLQGRGKAAEKDNEGKDKDGKEKGKDDKERRSRVRPLLATATVFNVDTVREGNLERVSHDIIKVNLLDKSGQADRIFGRGATPTIVWAPILKDLSEWPPLFLLILVLLVAEQALAVHLSFHLKGNETFAAAGQPKQPAAAA